MPRKLCESYCWDNQRRSSFSNLKIALNNSQLIDEVGHEITRLYTPIFVTFNDLYFKVWEIDIRKLITFLIEHNSQIKSMLNY